MAVALTRENFLLHKIHSITGVIPVGYYVVQHLTLNSFSLAGPEKFNGVIGFFEGMPKFFLLAVEVLAIWVPLLFHAVYGIFITGRSQQNFIGTKYGWSENRMYTFQRYSGIFLFFFLIYHTLSTTGVKYATGSSTGLLYQAWHDKLTSFGFVFLIIYALGVLTASYHLAYGIWNFCIRWGITVSDEAQRRIQKVSFLIFVGVTLVGWAALVGFLLNIHPSTSTTAMSPAPVAVTASIPTSTQP
jgi:succinate dehydrogenase / fumarate reductase, cytochrome b subunit